MNAERLDVLSKDGTSIAAWVEGEGPPLVMVHGSLMDHASTRPMVDELKATFTTVALDRRGFGASGDTSPYSIQREFEDAASVVEAAASHFHGPLLLWGHSFGASCAMGAATLADGIDYLVLYEPSLGLSYPPGSIDAMEEALRRGEREVAIELVLKMALELSADEIKALRSRPDWPARVAVAHTIPREARAEESWSFQPGQFSSITAATTFLSGTESTTSVKDATRNAAAAIAGSRVHHLEGHGHLAHRTHPAMLAEFLRGLVLR